MSKSSLKVMGFVGATDPESEECRRVLHQFGSPCAQALFPRASGKSPVRANQAYDPMVTFRESVPDSVRYLIFIECFVPAALRERAEDIGAQILVCDHHNPGDPGFEMAPKDFLKGSSLGQLLAYCGFEPTETQRLIAANDHCLSAAARGECPGVDPLALLNHRNATRARWRELPVEIIVAEVERATRLLTEAPRKVIGDEEVVCLTAKDLSSHKEIATAAAWFRGTGIGYLYEYLNPYTKDHKHGIMGVRPETVTHWLTEVATKDLALNTARTYGCAARGYAGGYV